MSYFFFDWYDQTTPIKVNTVKNQDFDNNNSDNNSDNSDNNTSDNNTSDNNNSDKFRRNLLLMYVKKYCKNNLLKTIAFGLDII